MSPRRKPPNADDRVANRIVLLIVVVFGLFALYLTHPIIFIVVAVVAATFVFLAILGKKLRKREQEERARQSLEELLRQQEERRQQPSTIEITNRLNAVRYMSGAQFEVFVADIMRGMGSRATMLGGSGDQGVDVIATAGNERIAIQCKQHSRPVGNKPVQEVFAGAKHHRCTKAMVVAPMGFTKGAIALAKSVGVELHDRNSLRMWIGRIQPAPHERRTVDLVAESAEQKQPRSEPSARRTVDLDEESGTRRENTMGEGHMKKHTVSVGTDTLGETVSFTAKRLGTAHVNGGKVNENENGMDFTYYRLPDDTYRVLVEGKGVNMLEPANTAEALRRREPIKYRRWTYEELQNQGQYGRVFAKLMERHPEGKKRNVRDLDQVWDEQVTERGMEKHTISVGTDKLGETVTFTAKLIGTVEANGGSQGGGIDITLYQLPDNTYRALVVKEDIRNLEPSNFPKVFGTDQPAEYGRWTFEELRNKTFYGEAFTKLMKVHPEGQKHNVRALD